MYDLSNFFNYLANEGSFSDLRGDVVGRDEFRSHLRDILVDTCFTNDTGKYETAVRVNQDPMVVVQDYDTREEAELGHKYWVQTCSNKAFVLDSIQNMEIRVYE